MYFSFYFSRIQLNSYKSIKYGFVVVGVCLPLLRGAFIVICVCSCIFLVFLLQFER